MPTILARPEGSFPMVTPFECRAVPTSLGANPNDLCAPSVPADPAVPVAAAPAATVAGAVPAVPAVPVVVVPQVTAGMVATALRQVPLPAPELQVQPPNGRTLVNFETNFFTEPGGFLRTVTLLGQQVDLDITAASYTWIFGDGDATQTAGPGAPYPGLEVTHRYLRQGAFQARVDTTYVARYRVEGGAWAPVPGSVTVPGGPVPLTAVTARPTLVR